MQKPSNHGQWTLNGDEDDDDDDDDNDIHTHHTHTHTYIHKNIHTNIQKHKLAT